MVNLQNLTGRKITINLDHETMCSDGGCSCEETVMRARVLNGKTGESGVREIPRLLCASVHLLPKAISQSLPESVLKLDDVKSRLVGRVPSLAVLAVKAS